MLAVHQDAAAKLAPRISTDEYSIGHQIEQVTLKASMVLIIINLMNEKWLSHFGYQGHPAPRRYSHPPPLLSLSFHEAVSPGDLDQNVEDPTIDWSISIARPHFRPCSTLDYPCYPWRSDEGLWSFHKAKAAHFLMSKTPSSSRAGLSSFHHGLAWFVGAGLSI